jgi:hypothetical protein
VINAEVERESPDATVLLGRLISAIEELNRTIEGRSERMTRGERALLMVGIYTAVIATISLIGVDRVAHALEYLVHTFRWLPALASASASRPGPDVRGRGLSVSDSGAPGIGTFE